MTAENLELWNLEPEFVPEGIDPNMDAIRTSFLSAGDKSRLFVQHLTNRVFANDNPPFDENKETSLRSFLPYSDLMGWTHEGEILSEGMDALDLHRIGYVRVLSNVSYWREKKADYSDLFVSRLSHSIVVARTLEAIMKNNAFSQEEIDLGVVAALLHDRATPALGDATKIVDKTELDEEDFWWENLPDDAWKFIYKHGGDKEKLDAIIHNKGALGEILDIADKIGYTMVDMWQAGRSPLPPKFGNIYQDVAYDRQTDQVYFRNARRLKWLPYERGQMFSRVYVSDDSQAADFVFAALLAPYYSRDGGEGKLSSHQLRTMNDWDLIDFLSSQYGFNRHDFYRTENWEPYHYSFDDIETAVECAEAMKRDGYKVIGIKEKQGFKPAVDLKTLDPVTNTILPLEQVYPAWSDLIKMGADESVGFEVVYCQRNTGTLLDLVPEAIAGRVGL